MNKIFLAAALAIFTTSLSLAAESKQTLSEREHNLQRIENFLRHPDIEPVVVEKRGKNIDVLIAKYNKRLSDKQLRKLADNADSLLLLGGQSSTTNVESQTAENIADKFLQLGWAALILAILIPVLILISL